MYYIYWYIFKRIKSLWIRKLNWFVKSVSIASPKRLSKNFFPKEKGNWKLTMDLLHSKKATCKPLQCPSFRHSLGFLPSCGHNRDQHTLRHSWGEITSVYVLPVSFRYFVSLATDCTFLLTVTFELGVHHIRHQNVMKESKTNA